MKYYFSPSLMCMNLMELKDQLEVMKGRADYLHVDIMDGHYVKNITLSPTFMEQIKGVTSIPMDAHLMVENPAEFIDMVAKAGASVISVHAETINKDAFRIINRIKELGCEVGIVLNPATPLEYIQHYIGLVDKLTFMTVDPGFAGQPFIPAVLDKLRKARALREEQGFHYIIEVDGSCNEKTYKVLAQAGAEAFIVGSSGLFNLHQDLVTAWDLMMAGFNREVQPS